MKKFYIVLVISLLLMAGRKVQDQPLYSHYTSWAYQGVAPQTWIPFATLEWSVVNENYYHVENGAFVAPEKVLTKISGTCQQKWNYPVMIDVSVDGWGYGYIVNTTEGAFSFVYSEYGRVFDIRIKSDNPVQCNVLLEAVK